MAGFFSIETIAFTIIGYPMSYLELVGTILYLWSVWLIAQRRMLTWPVGIISVILYMMLFYQIRLYSDALEQIYYLAASAYGWWRWSGSKQESGRVTGSRFSSPRGVLLAVSITLCLSVLLGYGMTRIDTFWPALFPEPADYPYLDAFTTITSFTAMLLMARQRTESWIYWIIVDVIGIWLYYVKEVRFISLLYVILLILATKGLLSWLKEGRESISR